MKRTAITKRKRKPLGKAQILTDAELDQLAAVTPDPALIEQAKAHATRYGPVGFVAKLDAGKTETTNNEEA